jgi:hypothetical protein
MELFPSTYTVATFLTFVKFILDLFSWACRKKKTPRLAGGSLLGAVSLAVAYKLYKLATL